MLFSFFLLPFLTKKKEQKNVLVFQNGKAVPVFYKKKLVIPDEIKERTC